MIFLIDCAIVIVAKGDDGHPRTQKRTPQELQLLGGSCLFTADWAVWAVCCGYVSSLSNHLHR